MLKKNLANIITMVRIIGTAVLLFVTPLSTAWLIVYAVCGVSDVADGTVARHFHLSSAIGARLDTTADIFFYVVMLVQLLPLLVTRVSTWLWYIVGFIVLIRVLYYLFSFLRYHTLASTHAILNKLTSFMIFLVPFLMNTGSVLRAYALVLMGVAFSAALQDWRHYLPEKVEKNFLPEERHNG